MAATEKPDQQDPAVRARKLAGALRQGHKRIARERILTPVITSFAILAGGTALLLVAEQRFWLDPLLKSAALATLLAAAAVTAVRGLRGRQPESFTRFYRSFCRAFGWSELQDGLDLWFDPQSPRKELLFHQLAIDRNLRETEPELLQQRLADYHASQPERRRLLLRSGLLLAALLPAAGLLWHDPGAGARTLAFWQPFEQPNPWQFEITPADTTFEHGTALTTSIRFSPEGAAPPSQVRLAIRTGSSETFRERPMNPLEEQTFLSDPIELTSDAEWFIRMGSFRSELQQTAVRLPPRFDELAARIEPPPYTRLEAENREYPFSRLRLYPGSQVTLQGRLNRPPENLTLYLGDRELAMETRAQTGDSLDWQTRFTATRPDTVTIDLEDRHGLTARIPYRFDLELLEDEPPVVVIRRPAEDLLLSEPDRLEIHYRAADDFGLTRAELHWELQRAFTDRPQEGAIGLDRPETGRTETFFWDLHPLELRPRDRLVFWITVWDNDEVSGYKPGSSRRIAIEVPSLADRMESVADREDRSRDRLHRIRESYSEMESDYERLREQLRRNHEPSWQEQQMAEELSGRHREVEEQIRTLSEQFEELRREIESGDRISEETRSAYRELQQLFEELDDPELRRAIEELRRAMAELSPPDLERALENFEFNEQLYRERIERTLELFRSLQMNSELDRLAAQFEDLSERLTELSGSTADAQEQHREQLSVRRDSEPLGRQLDELGNQAPERAAERLQVLKSETSQELQEILEQMDRLIERGEEQAASRQARSERQQMAERLAERADALRQARQQISGQQLQVNLIALQRSLYWLLELSEAQEVISEEAEQMEPRSQGFVELARRQQHIRGQFTRLADTLYQITAEIPQLSGNINRSRAEVGQLLALSVDQMAERDRRSASLASLQTLGGLNRLASMLGDAIDQLLRQQQQGGAGSLSMEQMLEQMQNMSGEQQEMNRQLQEMINDIQGERLTMEESERLEQFAARQNEIRRQIRQLQQSGGFRPGESILSELERAAEQMEEAINEMRGGATDPLMNDRQQNILSRMLRVEESLQQQGESDELEGQRASETDAPPPGVMSLEELEQVIRSRLHDPQYSRFRREYQQLIERYFDRIRQLEEVPAGR